MFHIDRLLDGTSFLSEDYPRLERLVDELLDAYRSNPSDEALKEAQSFLERAFDASASKAINEIIKKQNAKATKHHQRWSNARVLPVLKRYLDTSFQETRRDYIEGALSKFLASDKDASSEFDDLLKEALA